MKESFEFKRSERKAELELVVKNGEAVLHKISNEESANETEDFKVSKETKYGPHLVRNTLTDIQRNALSHALAAVGAFTAAHSAPPEKLIQTDKTEVIAQGNNRVEKEVDIKTNVEMEEKESFDSSFNNEVSGYEARANLRFDEVQFVDEMNRPIGDPVKLDTFTIEKNGKPYLVTPGPVDELGILTDGIAGEWLAIKKRELKQKYPQVDSIRVLGVAANFEAALRTTDEPELVAGIANGQITTYKQLVEYYANKPVVGTENLSRKEYVQTAIRFDSNVPEVAQAEFRKLVAGLCMQETGFNNGLVSRTGARGIFQFQPATWEEQGGYPHEINSLMKQTELAGKYISQLYKQVQHFSGMEAMGILRSKHTDEELVRDVLVPLTLNSYNAGASRVGAAVKEYFAIESNRDKNLKGKDLYQDIADFARAGTGGKLKSYGDDARQYSTRIYGNAAVLAESGSKQPNIKVAFNF